MKDKKYATINLYQQQRFEISKNFSRLICFHREAIKYFGFKFLSDFNGNSKKSYNQIFMNY